MAFEKSVAKTRESEWAAVVWRTGPNSADPTLVTPNLRFDKKVGDEWEVSHLLSKGDMPNLKITGVPIGISAFAKEGYNDKKNATGEKNEFHLRIAMDNGPNKPLSILTAKLKSDTDTTDRDTLQLLNLLHAYTMGVADGSIPKGEGLQIGLYRSKKNPDFPAMTLRMSSGVSESGDFLFDQQDKTVHADGFAPHPTPILDATGKQLVVQGIKAVDHTIPKEWAEQKIGEIMESGVFTHKEAQADAPPAAPAQEDDGIDLNDAVDSALAGAARHRQAG